MGDLTSFRETLRARRRCFGGWTSLGHPSITEMLAASTVDFVGIDLEHSTISLEQSQRIIAAAQAAGVSCLPRIASHNGEQLQRLLDAGPDGVIVPNVTTEEEVERIVAWTKYPPVGRRSYGVSRAQDYGMNFEAYTKIWNERSSIIIQIESAKSAEMADRLLAHEAVDGAMIGPYDISGSLGIPGQLAHPKVTQAASRVIEACRRHSKACGTQLVEPDPEQVEAAFAAGYTFVVLASDVFILWKWSERMRVLISAQRKSQTAPRARRAGAAVVKR